MAKNNTSKKKAHPADPFNHERVVDKAHDDRVALALIVRRHLLDYRLDVLHEHEKLIAKHAGDRKGGVDAQRSIKPSTALAQLIGLPAYQNVKKGKPEPAKHLLDFMQSAGPAHFDEIFEYFRGEVITPKYRGAAPDYIQMAIHQVFDQPKKDRTASSDLAAASNVRVLDDDLRSAREQALSSPHAVVAAIEETLPKLIEKAAVLVGTWHVIRYAHHGRRIVRLVLEVKQHASGRLTFRLYFRTYGMTMSQSREVYVTRGSVIVLKGGQHVKFWGYEEPLHAGSDVDSYPVSITCPTRITRDGPFMGLVERRHDDGKIFAIKAQFIREKSRSIDELLADKVGSYESQEDIARMLDDITGADALLAELRRNSDDDRGGLVL